MAVGVFNSLISGKAHKCLSACEAKAVLRGRPLVSQLAVIPTEGRFDVRG